MPIPTHNDRCVTKAFMTNCPDCRDDVWFFSCNCGSKVYFNDLGWPWDQHICKDRVLREAIQLVRLSDRLSETEIYNRIDALAKRKGLEIPEDIAEMLDSELGKRKFDLKVIPISDLTGITNISGRVMQVNKEVSFVKRYNIDVNKPLTKGLAGELVNSSFSEIFIREHPNMKNECREFQVFVERNYLASNPISIGKTILANVSTMNSKMVKLWKIVGHKCY